MIFRRSLRRELSNLAGVVFTALFTIMLTTLLIRLLGRAAGGRVDTASVLPMIAFLSVNYLPVLLVLTLYVAVLMALTRAYRESEMVVWFATGRSVADWIRPVLQFALPFIVVVTAVSFVVAPWANGKVSEYQQRFAQREDVSQVAPGQFRESASADRVFFVESISEDEQSVRNVFVSQLRGEKLTIVVAAGGRVENQPDGERFLVLDKGRRYDGERTSQEFRLMEFDRYAVRLEPKSIAVRDDSAKVKPTLELLRDPTPRNLGELMWRMSMPIASVTLVLLAIPLSSFNPRAGRSVNLMVALLIYVIYNNMVSVSQAWLFQSKLSFPVAAFGAHLAVLAIAAFLFWRRLRMPRRPWRWRRARAAA